MKEYIHYGSDRFNHDLFSPVRNRKLFTKPFGGLWASNLNSKYGWKEWNQDNEFVDCSEEDSFKFTLREGTRILIISSVNDLKNLPKSSEKNLPDYLRDFSEDDEYYLDFEELSKSYDAIELTTIGNGLYEALYGWDCECILVMNPDCVEEIS